MADQTRIRQALSICAANRQQVTGMQRTVEVARRHEQGHRRDTRWPEGITGIGMSAAGEAVFQEFVQADSSTTRTMADRAGLCAPAAVSARWMGGEISVESQLGKG